MSRPVKHSLTLGGHRTSVTLEEPFWQAFRDIAVLEGKGINALAAEIDSARASNGAVSGGVAAGLATAIRLYVLAHYRNS
jgi:predicted DNA-binding ribbon-helix-helix protein